MKKSWIAIFAVIVFVSGCHRKDENEVGLSKKKYHRPNWQVELFQSGSPNTVMMPPSVTKNQNPARDFDGDDIMYSVYFVKVDGVSEVVTIHDNNSSDVPDRIYWNGQGAAPIGNFIQVQPSTWVAYDQNYDTYQVTVQIGGNAINNPTNAPIPNGQNTIGLDVSTFTDGNGSTVYVLVQDLP